MMNTPSISVVIPCHNGERYLAAAIASVRAQTLPAAEILVVDNASTDGTAALARSLGVRCEAEPEPGAARARNRGLSAVTGEYLALLDADDLWLPQKLERQTAAFLAQPELAAVFGLLEHFISPDLPAEEAARLHCPAGAAPARLPSLLLMRATTFAQVGPFSTEWVIGDIVDWLARFEALGLRSAIVPEVLAQRRLHAHNLGRTGRDQRGDYLRILKQKLDRERAAKASRTES